MDSDSDDDLVDPSFLRKPTNTINVVITPRKAIRPANDVSLSPATPNFTSMVNKKNGKNVKAKFSLSSLLDEKQIEAVEQEKVEDIIELERKFCDRDYFENLEEENMDASQLSQSQELDYSQDLCSQEPYTFCQPLKDENEKKDFGKVIDLIQRGNDFPTTFPGEKIFIHAIGNPDIHQYIKTLASFVMGENIADSDIESQNEEELLHDILQMCVPTVDIPDNICQTLWKITYTIQDFKISQNAMMKLINSISNRDMMSKDFQWLPSITDFVDCITYLGAGKTLLIPNYFPEDINSMPFKLNQDELKKEFVDERSNRKALSLRIQNLQSAVKVFTVCVQIFPTNYSSDTLNFLLMMTFRLSIERLLQVIFLDLKVLIGTLLDAYTPEQWIKEVYTITTRISNFPLHHHNFLQLVESIPPTSRGIQFQQIVAFKVAKILFTDKSSILQTDDITCHKYPYMPGDICDLIVNSKPNNETDYYELHSAFSLLSWVLSVDDIPASQKVTILKLSSKLKSIHNEIKECRGVYLDRTKVKDIILRLISRYTFAERNLQTQCPIDNYFGRTATEIIKIENIQQSSFETDDSDTDEEACHEDTDVTETIKDDSPTNMIIDTNTENTKIIENISESASVVRNDSNTVEEKNTLTQSFIDDTNMQNNINALYRVNVTTDAIMEDSTDPTG